MIEDFMDIRTLSLVTSIVSISSFVVMLYVAIKGKTYPGFIEWTLATGCSCLGMSLLAMRDFLPDFLTVIVANNFVLLYLVLIGRGIIRFSGNKQKIWLDIAGPLILTLTFVYFTYDNPNVSARVIVITALMFLLCCWICYLILSKMPRINSKRHLFPFFVFAYFGLSHLLRLIQTIIWERNLTSFMEPSFIQGFAFVNIIITSIITSMLFLVANSNRFEQDLMKANEEIQTLSGLLPICSNCKRIRSNDGEWENLESYISNHSKAFFSHGICPECTKELYSDLF